MDKPMLRIPIARLGRWYHPIYKNRKGEPVVEFTQDDFDSIIHVFATDDRGYEPYLTYGHLKDKFDKFTVDGFPIVGYLKALEQEGEILFGDFEPANDRVAQEIQDGNYRYASGEFIPNAKAKKSDAVFRMFLKGVALTNTPFVPNLPLNRVKSADEDLADDNALGRPFVLLTDYLESPDGELDKEDQDQIVVEGLDQFNPGDKFLVPDVVKGVLLVAINTANRVDPNKYAIQISLAQDLINSPELTLDLANRLGICYKELDENPDYLAEMLCGGDAFRLWVSQALESIEKVVDPVEDKEGPDTEMSEETRLENTQDDVLEKTEDVKEIKSMLSEFTDWMKNLFVGKQIVDETSQVEETAVLADDPTPEVETPTLTDEVVVEEPPVVEIEENKMEDNVMPVAPAPDAEMLAKLAAMEEEKAKLEAAVKELSDKAAALEHEKLAAEKAAVEQRLSDRVADLTNKFGLAPAVAEKVRTLVSNTNETVVSLSDGNQMNLGDAVFDLVNALMDDSSRVDLDQVGAAGDVNALSDEADNPWADVINKYRAQSK